MIQTHIKDNGFTLRFESEDVLEYARWKDLIGSERTFMDNLATFCPITVTYSLYEQAKIDHAQSNLEVDIFPYQALRDYLWSYFNTNGRIILNLYQIAKGTWTPSQKLTVVPEIEFHYTPEELYNEGSN